MSEIWTIKKILNWTKDYLERRGDEHPRLSAEWLLCNATGLSRVELYTNFDKPLSSDELALMHTNVEKRAAGEPLQYVTGEMPFRHIVLRCETGVLIPRPETEVLVDTCLEFLDSLDTTHPQVLEIGTGTGCIALSLASECLTTQITATDISPQAVELAKRNRDALELEERVDIIQCNLADGVDPAQFGSFDLLVSNPPYIPTATLERDVPAEVRDFEPELALDGGPDGLDVFRQICKLAPQVLAPGGAMILELSEDNVELAAHEMSGLAEWGSIEVREDLTHRPRVLYARYQIAVSEEM